MFVLDTDSITHDQNAHPVLAEKVRNTPRDQLFTTSVTVEEQFKGRLAYINRSVVTTNRHDFTQVPNLKMEDWTLSARG